VELIEAMQTCRAIRRFRPDPVPTELIVECLRAATYAPSGSNEQAWKFCVLQSKQARELLGPAYRQGWRNTAALYGIERPAADDASRRARSTRAIFEFVDNFERIPLYVLFCARHHPNHPELFVGASIYPALQNVLLAARERGLGGLITTWFRECESDLRALVGIPDGWQIAALVPVGYPKGGHGTVRRGAVEDVLCWDHWASMRDGATG
jgi:nitroreductase